MTNRKDDSVKKSQDNQKKQAPFVRWKRLLSVLSQIFKFKPLSSQKIIGVGSKSTHEQVTFKRTGNLEKDARNLRVYLDSFSLPHKYFFYRKYEGGQPLHIINFDKFKFGFCRSFTPDIIYTWEYVMFTIEINGQVKKAFLFNIPQVIQNLINNFKWR